MGDVMARIGQKVWKDGKFIKWDDANIHVLSHVVQYGSSVFEGIRCYDTDKGPAVFRLEAHMQRLINSAKMYRMPLKYSLEELCDAVIETIRINELGACYIRPFVIRGFGAFGVNPMDNPLESYIAAWEWGQYLGEEALESGVDVCVSSWNRIAPNTLPTLAKAGANYMNSQLIKMEAIINGYTEGIALNSNGLVSEGSGENIFIVNGNIVSTPPISSSVLPGITRNTIIEILEANGYTVKEEGIPRERLYISDEVFFTGTAAEVTPIRSIDKITIGSGKRGVVAKKVQEDFFKIFTGENSKIADGKLTFI
jgi:branched-chain amino acid aminotransferase